MIHLGTLGGEQSVAYALNDRGQVVGLSMTAGGSWHAFSWTREYGMIDLGTLGGESNASAVNAHGQVVGYSYVVEADGQEDPGEVRFMRSRGPPPAA